MASTDHTSRVDVRIQPWDESDLPLLKMTMGDTEMTKHLGGPESDEQLAARHAKYVALPDTGTGAMYTIVDDDTGQKVGSVGYWEKDWNGAEVYETGWHVVPAFQGRGIAVAGTAQVIAVLRGLKRRRYLHAFPSIENLPSNAICRKLGFTFLEEHEFEFPKGHFMRCNDWRLDLFAEETPGETVA